MTLADELAELCSSCGLCCNGTIFAVGRLDPEEVEPARSLGLRVLPTSVFELPCPQHDGRRCTVYASRPKVCAKYECRLRRDHASKGDALAPKLAATGRARELAARVAAKIPAGGTSLIKRIDQLLADGGLEALRHDPELALDITELAMRLERDFGVEVERGPPG